MYVLEESNFSSLVGICAAFKHDKLCALCCSCWQNGAVPLSRKSGLFRFLSSPAEILTLHQLPVLILILLSMILVNMKPFGFWCKEKNLFCSKVSSALEPILAAVTRKQEKQKAEEVKADLELSSWLEACCCHSTYVFPTGPIAWEFIYLSWKDAATEEDQNLTLCRVASSQMTEEQLGHKTRNGWFSACFLLICSFLSFYFLELVPQPDKCTSKSALLLEWMPSLVWKKIYSSPIPSEASAEKPFSGGLQDCYSL